MARLSETGHVLLLCDQSGILLLQSWAVGRFTSQDGGRNRLSGAYV